MHREEREREAREEDSGILVIESFHFTCGTQKNSESTNVRSGNLLNYVYQTPAYEIWPC